MKFFLSCVALVTMVAVPMTMANEIEFDTYDQDCRTELTYLVCK